MPGRKEYNLSLEDTFPGGRKNWESFNGKIINKMMDQGLAIFIDIAICLHMYMQASLQDCSTEQSLGDSAPHTPGLPQSARRRLGRELRKIDNRPVSPQPTSSEATAETGSRSVRQEQPTAPDIDHPLLPEHLDDPAFEQHWTHA